MSFVDVFCKFCLEINFDAYFDDLLCVVSHCLPCWCWFKLLYFLGDECGSQIASGHKLEGYTCSSANVVIQQDEVLVNENVT